MKVKLPTRFKVEYPKKNLKYFSGTSKKKIAELLLNSCKGYCMYCGKTVITESNENYHLEHSVDKDGNQNQALDKYNVLKNCKFNLAISCSVCNTKCKKVVDKIDLNKYAPIDKCPATCSNICEKYSDIREEYMRKNAIILQPIGKGDDGSYEIAYNLFKHIYEPDCGDEQDEIKFFIQNHIDRFELNFHRFSTSIINTSVKVVTWYDGGIKDYENMINALENEVYTNIIGEKYKDFLKEVFSEKPISDMVDFCRLLVVLDSVP